MKDANNEIKQILYNLGEQAVDALEKIKGGDVTKMGAVNWGDIGVREVRYWCNDKDEVGYTISVEEAAPDCKLGLAIWKEMGEPEDVEVVCEW